MRNIKVAVLLASLFITTSAIAEVPVIDAYQDSPNQSSSISTSNSSVTPSSNNAAAQIVSSSSSASLPTDQRITVLERQVANLSQLLVQFNDMQQQVQDLRGKLEVQKHDLQVLQEQVRSQYKDLDQRVTGNTNTSKPIVKPIGAPAASAIPAPTADVTADSAPTDNGDGAYQAAYDLLTKKKYPQATTGFQNFIKKYPNNKQITEARYFLGMVYVVQGQPEHAIPQFQTILKKSPQNKRAADAMYQLGMAYYAKGDSKKAVVALKTVQEKYPDSQAATYAKNRLQQIQQSSAV